MDLIKNQGYYFLSSLLWGFIIFFLYDFLRVFRKFIPHAFFFRALEDLIFWLISSVLVFQMIFQRNNGILRIFFLFAFVYGMYSYQTLVKDSFVNTAEKFIRFLFAPFAFLLRQSKKIIKFVLHKLDKYFIMKPKHFYNDRKAAAENKRAAKQKSKRKSDPKPKRVKKKRLSKKKT